MPPSTIIPGLRPTPSAPSTRSRPSSLRSNDCAPYPRGHRAGSGVVGSPPVTMGMASSPEQPGAAHDAWRTAVAALLGFGLLIAYVGFHRTRLLPNADFGVPGAFRADAVIAVLHACAGLLFINMA